MKIRGTSSYIVVETAGKEVKIQGELLVNGFVAYIDTIKCWEPPYEEIVIDDEAKQQLIKDILQESKKTGFKIEFE